MCDRDIGSGGDKATMKYKFYMLVRCVCLFTFLACKTTPCETILDSLQYIITLPDANSCSAGDSLSEKIIQKGVIIVPELIEKIIDTTKTKINARDNSDYFTVSDVAISLIDRIDKQFPTYYLLLCEFYHALGPTTYKHVYYATFFSDDQEGNYKNRLRFYNRVKKWYNEGKKYRCKDNPDMITDPPW